MNKMFKIFLKLWAKSNFATGYLYQFINSYHFKKNYRNNMAYIRGDNQINCDLTDHVQRQIYFFGSYEPIESFQLSQLIREESIIFDIGANIGFYSLILSSHLKGGHIYAFEAVENTFNKLMKNIQQSNKEDKITALNLGAWDKEEKVTFRLPDHENIGSFTAGPIFQNVKITCKAEMTRLDHFVEKNKIRKVDFIKMDIEGAELKALQGSLITLKRFRPTLLLEVCESTCKRFSYTVNDLWILLSSLGYRAYLIGQSKAGILEIKNFNNITQNNILLSTTDILKTLSHWDDKKIKAYYSQTLRVF